MTTLSPFSLSHDWNLVWKRLSSVSPPRLIGGSPKEIRAAKAIASIGAIGGVQLSRIFFNRDRKRGPRMAKTYRLVRHEIIKGKQPIPIYTLGPNGAIMAGLSDYEVNYWVTYRVEDVLKRLLFFQLYDKFPDAPPILPAPPPFIGTILFQEKPLYVYVVRGKIEDLLMYLKWHSLRERMIIITESLHHLEPFNMFASELKVRVTTDLDLKGDFDELFYQWTENGWMKEKDITMVGTMR